MPIMTKDERIKTIAAALAERLEAEHVARIQALTMDEKWAELKRYYEAGGVLNLDIDRLKYDQAVMNAPDSALDDALAMCATLCGAALGRGPVTAQEAKEGFRQARQQARSERRASRPSPIQLDESPVSLRKNEQT